MSTYYEPEYNFFHNSMKDLLDAREHAHIDFMTRQNVVATAIGRYLIRTSDLDANGKIIQSLPGVQKSERNLQNSIVVPESWPCVLVFVEEWETEAELLHKGDGNVIDKKISLSDGRKIPVCVVKAPKVHAENTDVNIDTLNFPVNLVGGGAPMIIHSQGIDHVATIGCVVSNGHTAFALTNRHVTGAVEGQIIETRMGDDRVPIGKSAGLSLGKIQFSHLYPGWNGDHIQVSCDAGLVEIDDVTRWKTDVIGIPFLDEMYDLNTSNFNTSLIAEHKLSKGKIENSLSGNVTGYGAVSGLVKGEIIGLFYRYKAVAGVEYVSDFLISGRNGDPLTVDHGDSGFLWMLECPDKKKTIHYRPIALHWGHHRMIIDGQSSRFAYSLSTSLSNICRELDVELVRGWNIDQDFSWGKMFHYTIGNRAIAAVSKLPDGDLKKLMKANLRNISVRDTDINIDLVAKNNPDLNSNPDQGFCPLADVPDIIWKQAKLSPDGTKGTEWGRKGDENPNHYCDVDAPVKNSGKTMFDLCDSPEKMTIPLWRDYYKNIDKEKIGLDPNKPVSEGLVCFRVWQIFDYMAEAAKKNKMDQFIFGAGVLAHYIGDSCQPLHSSYMSNGNPADNELIDYTAKKTSFKKNGAISHKKGDVYKKVVNPGDGVHVAYEDHMPDDNIEDILNKLDNVLDDPQSRINSEVISPITNGKEAAFANLTLMRLTQADIPPVEIVEAFKQAKGTTNVSEALYEQFGEKTIDCVARGCNYLAAVWEAAWVEGRKGVNSSPDLTKVDQQKLIKLYRDPKQLQSFHLDTIGAILKN